MFKIELCSVRLGGRGGLTDSIPCRLGCDAHTKGWVRDSFTQYMEKIHPYCWWLDDFFSYTVQASHGYELISNKYPSKPIRGISVGSLETPETHGTSLFS